VEKKGTVGDSLALGGPFGGARERNRSWGERRGSKKIPPEKVIFKGVSASPYRKIGALRRESSRGFLDIFQNIGCRGLFLAWKNEERLFMEGTVGETERRSFT